MTLPINSKIFIAGHQGMVGSALIRAFKARGYENIHTQTRAQLDLVEQGAVRQFLQQEDFDYIIIAAAKVGGIHANNVYPAEFCYQNLMIATNLIHQAYLAGVTRLLFLGSSCIYPKFAEQPIQENALLSGQLEQTNEPYAIAKIAGIKLCESYNRQYGTDYRALMPCNLYGPEDNFHLENSHVVPALLKKFHHAKQRNENSVVVWGTGNARREFLHVDDIAHACLHLASLPTKELDSISAPMCSHLNAGAGEDVSILDLATIIKSIVGFDGDIHFDTSKPDGTMRKLMDSSKLSSLGWRPHFTLADGLQNTYFWYLDNERHLRLK